MFKIFKTIKKEMAELDKGFESEISTNVNAKISSLLELEGTQINFDTRTERIAIRNPRFDVDVLVNPETSTITLIHNGSVESAVHNVVTISTIKEMCESHNHKVFIGYFNTINHKRLIKLKGTDFTKQNDELASV